MYTHDIELNPGFGQRLAQARKALKLSAAEVGRLVGYTDRTVRKWEREDTRPRGSDLSLLQERTGICVGWVAEGKEPMQATAREVAPFMGEILGKTLGEPVYGRLYDMMPMPPKSFMAPLLQEGDALLLVHPLPIESGRIYVVTLPKGGFRVGRLFQDSEGKWVLYSDEDLQRPGTCPPLTVEMEQLSGRVTGYIRGLGEA